MGTASMKVLIIPLGMMFFKGCGRGTVKAKCSCIALSALRDREHGVLGTRGVLYNTCEETTKVEHAQQP